MQTGVPAQPAANVARLAPGFVHSFSFNAFLVAVSASGIWSWLVYWRIGRHRTAIWKSVVLPAGGAALCWLLLMTLWLPLLDFARSYAPLVKQITVLVPGKPPCVSGLGLSRSQIAAIQFHSELVVRPMASGEICDWLVADAEYFGEFAKLQPSGSWLQVGTAHHPADRKERLLILKRTSGQVSF